MVDFRLNSATFETPEQPARFAVNWPDSLDATSGSTDAETADYFRPVRRDQEEGDIARAVCCGDRGACSVGTAASAFRNASPQGQA